jgi:hypothetical protein
VIGEGDILHLIIFALQVFKGLLVLFNDSILHHELLLQTVPLLLHNDQPPRELLLQERDLLMEFVVLSVDPRDLELVGNMLLLHCTHFITLFENHLMTFVDDLLVVLY